MPKTKDKVAPVSPLPARRAQDEPEKAKSGALGWLAGWVLLPAAFFGALFGGGVAVGVHFHDSWFSRGVMWVAGLF